MATTLVFITAVTGNLANYLAGGKGGAGGGEDSYGWVYDIDKVESLPCYLLPHPSLLPPPQHTHTCTIQAPWLSSSKGWE